MAQNTVQTEVSELNFRSMITSNGDRLIREHRIEILNKLSLAISCLIFFFIGAPLGVQSQRTGTSMGLGMSVVIIFAYYSVMTFMTGLGNGGALPPIIAALVPNALCGAFGLWLMWKKDQ